MSAGTQLREFESVPRRLQTVIPRTSCLTETWVTSIERHKNTITSNPPKKQARQSTDAIDAQLDANPLIVAQKQQAKE